MNSPGQKQVSRWDRPRPHDELRDALLLNLCQQPLRAAWGELHLNDERARPDVYAVTIRGNAFTQPHIFEVKAQRADFQGELRSGKWRNYLPACCRFDFVTLPGIATRSEIPDEAGWLEYVDGQFKRRKRAQVREAEVPGYLLMRMALHRAPQMPVGRAWVTQQWIEHIEGKRQLGRAVAQILRDRNKARADLMRLQAEVHEAEARLLRLQAADAHPPYATSDLFEAPDLSEASRG